VARAQESMTFGNAKKAFRVRFLKRLAKALDDDKNPDFAL
jgi:hypothetical protein